MKFVRDLTLHQVGVGVASDSLSTHLLGQSEPGYECFIFGLVIRGFEIKLERVFDGYAMGAFQYDPYSAAASEQEATRGRKWVNYFWVELYV